MLLAIARNSLVVLTLVLVALTSLVPISHLAPDRQDVERAEILSIYNASLVELCVTGKSERDHECPLCHKLPDAPRFHVPHSERRLAWSLEHEQNGDLVLGHSFYRHQAAPRAPPISH